MTNPQLLSLLSKPHHGGILTGGNMLGNHDHHHHQECIADGLGDVLHAANGEETSAVANPPVTNVPWSNFDGLPFLLLESNRPKLLTNNRTIEITRIF